MQERWQRVKSLFGRARALSATGQQALLRQTDDTSVRAEVASLIGADQLAGDFLQTPSAMPDHARRGHLGPYRILMPLGRGGMGHVYLAMRDDGSYQKRVAIKTIAADSRDCPPAFIDRFRNERQILAALDHPGIVRLLDGGQDPSGLPYLVMEYVQGVPIDQACQRGGLGLPLPDRLRWFLAVCRAVRHAHGCLVVHGDLKPANILVGVDGQPKLIDFGAARFQKPELGVDAMAPGEHVLRLCTPQFASPELLRGELPTVASDVYALGVLLDVLLRPPSPDDGAAAPDAPAQRLGEGIVRSDPTAACAGPRDLACIVRRATCPEPAGRYADVAALTDDVDRYLQGRPVQARPVTLAYSFGCLLRRNRRVCVALAMAALWGVVVGGAMLRGAHPASRQAAAAAPTSTDAALQVDQLRGLLEGVRSRAQRGELQAKLALPLLYLAQGHLLISVGDADAARRSFVLGNEARRAAPPPPQMPSSPMAPPRPN